MWSWRTLFLPKTLPGNSVLWHYIFGHNETHISLPLSYGSLVNNHESANIAYASTGNDTVETGFMVRDDFQRGNRNVLNIRIQYIHKAHICTHTHIFKATKDIEAGQELFVFYGGKKWFDSKGVSYATVDYANTMWRPDLQPLPCWRNVEQATDANGLRSYTALSAIPSGTVLDISLCLAVPANFVGQFLVLRNSTLPGQTANVHAAYQQASDTLRTHCLCFCRPQKRKGN